MQQQFLEKFRVSQKEKASIFFFIETNSLVSYLTRMKYINSISNLKKSLRVLVHVFVLICKTQIKSLDAVASL